MLIWAMWLVLWLGVFGARLIKTVWSEITKLNQISAYCVALSAAITVIIASQFWLPVSSTHIALGWVFWVWLFREHIKRNKWKTKDYVDKSAIKNIALAWIVTLPVSWVIAWIIYLIIVKLS
jgi:PiT family inorganic phosphate transporter